MIYGLKFEDSDIRQLMNFLPATAPTKTTAYLSALRTPQNVQQLLKPVGPGLRAVEQKMKTVETSLFAPLADAFVDLIGSGGKRLRPALALLTAQMIAADEDENRQRRLVSLAAAVEMLHTATLVHDDVIDGALLRRGAPTLNAVWSQGATVLAGDYMFARAALFSAETENVRVIKLFSETLQIIVDGELRQLFARNQYEQARENYYERIYAKTASLFSAATESAALLYDQPEDRVQQLKEFGYNFGMAFQIVDDILDFSSDETTLGKPSGSDLRQGTLTLPFFYYLRGHPQPHQVVDRLTAARQQAEDGDERPLREEVRRVVEKIRTSEAISAARDEAIDFLDRAALNLSTFPDNRAKESLLGLCAFVVQRTS
ncbi:MAG: polyprenyl synthetase family protein [Caldilineaceae bacterium]|nr:polyprenyl synthetase family protein [Caldilineaceae bacterium]